FEKYYNLLVLYNEKFNITAITEKKEVYIKHFIDSALASPFFNVQNFIDVGSGGGFPAIPIMIMNENIKGTCLEATGKKCEFLNAVIKELGLKNASVINGRAEELAIKPEYREKFDLCSARAVARLNTLSEYCMPFVKVGGKFIALKGDAKEEIIEAENAIKVLGGKLKNLKEFELEGAKRTIIEIEKIEKTDKKYPRGRGKERKNPL
ncbi:MAG: 16S rRNA (guanine(527)-N(7))-methyltransferase RsmG, partial [Firmicutes bacterium]|nr:16S rRNA (guanine(527)-N(7))-methyltransferase RsmG [Candidatus Caballimonas caccae]